MSNVRPQIRPHEFANCHLLQNQHMKTSALFPLLALVLCVAMPSHSPAANLSPKSEDGQEIFLSGRIERGDADNLRRLLLARRAPALVIHLNSPGGSLQEAVLLAKIVETAALDTVVKENGICASACFFVWLAGNHRRASSQEVMVDPKTQSELREIGTVPGYVGLHRPFEQRLMSAENNQPTLMRGVANYLDEKLVPRRLIDAMMTHPSNDIYWLTDQDLADIGSYTPPVEEFLIQRCGYDRNSSSKVVAAILSQNRERVAQLQAGQEQSRTCEAEEASKLRQKGFRALRQSLKK
jgi:hypothetical protein